MASTTRPSLTSLVFLSAFALAFAFPKFSWWWTAWIAFIPALIAVEKSRGYRESFVAFFWFGALFFLMSIEWLRHVSLFGLFFVSALAALYFGVFGIGARFFLKHRRFALALAALPALWVVLEWIRTEIPVWGFGWNLAGYSQAKILPVARLASFLGVYGVSFLIVFVNTALFLAFRFIRDKINMREMTIATMAVAAFVGGMTALVHLPVPVAPSPAASIAAGVIQANIPQSEKWDPEFRASLLNQYIQLSAMAAAEKPELLVWPEAAWPGFFNEDAEAKDIQEFARSSKLALLAGSLYRDPVTRRIYNSTYLIDADGKVTNRYDKIRLVPFGEFVPAAGFFRLFGLEKFAHSLGVSEFSEGSEYTVFELKNPAEAGLKPDPASSDIKFSTLICFEDIFPQLSRAFVARGAQFLVMITNDAWFGESAAPYQHFQAATFRAIENGVPVIRASNTGVSGFIAPSGEVIAKIQDRFGSDTWITGGLSVMLPLAKHDTVYQRFGYRFPLICLGILLGVFGTLVISSPRGAKSSA